LATLVQLAAATKEIDRLHEQLVDCRGSLINLMDSDVFVFNLRKAATDAEAELRNENVEFSEWELEILLPCDVRQEDEVLVEVLCTRKRI